jgi:hypothetical protein
VVRLKQNHKTKKVKKYSQLEENAINLVIKTEYFKNWSYSSITKYNKYKEKWYKDQNKSSGVDAVLKETPKHL